VLKQPRNSDEDHARHIIDARHMRCNLLRWHHHASGQPADARVEMLATRGASAALAAVRGGCDGLTRVRCLGNTAASPTVARAAKSEEELAEVVASCRRAHAYRDVPLVRTYRRACACDKIARARA
jgi:hypothetical protein